MQTGLVTSENLVGILRNISQRRQSGCLELTIGDDKVSIVFSHGKIVDAFDSAATSAERVKKTLVGLGLVGENAQADCEALCQEMLAASKTEEQGAENLIKGIIRHDLLNFLYAININKQAIYNFNQFIPEVNKELVSGISVGQFLLDKASFEAELGRFNGIFPEGSRILKLDLAGLILSEEEQLLYNFISNNMPVSAVLTSGILSQYHVVIGLMSFYERAVIEVEQPEKRTSQEAPADLQVINALEVTSERPYVERELKPLAEPGEQETGNETGVADTGNTLQRDSGDRPAKSLQVRKENTYWKRARALTNRELNYRIYLPLTANLICIAGAIVMVVAYWARFFRGF